MEVITWDFILISLVISTVIIWAMKLLNWVWLRPQRLEKFLRQQGLNGNSYKPLIGDMKDFMRVMKEEQPKTIEFSDDPLPHVFSYYHQILTKYGKNSFIWFGPWPRLNIVDPEIIKEILRKPYSFEKPFGETGKIIAGGLTFLEGEKWAKHRKIITSAFHLDKLKNMVPAMGLSCSNMIENWKNMVSGTKEDWCEIDVWPYLEDLTGDVISRTTFGSSYEQGRRIFHLQREKLKLILQFAFIPGWRYLPTKSNRRVKAISKEIHSILRDIINKRQKAMDRGGSFPEEDLLGIIMESNSRFIQEHGNKNVGMSIEDVIDECKLFYFAGSETTSSLLVWAMILLCKYPGWQTRARAEVTRVFGNSEPNIEGLSQLKTVTMILQEVLRLYPPGLFTVREPIETVKLGNLTIPKGVHLTLLIGLLHYDPEIWGDDVKEFKPDRFSTSKIQSSFMPFSTGPRICLGQNFAMIEAKMAMVKILKSFSFELSPKYLHAPFSILTLLPQYGAPIILRNLES